jgi:hypothetical protein
MAENHFSVFAGALAGAFVAWALAALLRAAKAGRGRADSAGCLCLRYGPLMRGLMILGAASFASIFVALQFWLPRKNDLAAWVVFATLLPFALLEACGQWETNRFLLRISPEGLECRSAWRGWLRLPWKDVAEVSYSGSGACFVVSTSDGQRIRVPVYISGISQFLDECEKRLTWTMLQQAQKGYAQLSRPMPHRDV